MKEIFCFFIYTWYRMIHRLPQVSSIYFHDPSPDMFEMVLKWYRKHHYRIISLDELRVLLETKHNPDGKVAFISFDDGCRSNLQLLPICEKFNAPITIFLATEPLKSGNYWWEYVTEKCGIRTMLSFKKKPEIDFYTELEKVKQGMNLVRSAMTVSELVLLAKHPLVTIQPHSVNHPILTNLSDVSLKNELRDSKRQLEELTGEAMDVFSYPNGNVGPREIEELKNAGYKYAFTIQPEQFVLSEVDPFLLPRMCMNTNGGKYENLTKLLGIWYNIFGLREN